MGKRKRERGRRKKEDRRREQKNCPKTNPGSTILPLFAAAVSCSWHGVLPVWNQLPVRTELFYWLLRQCTHH
jgi:hypothetical protein